VLGSDIVMIFDECTPYRRKARRRARHRTGSHGAVAALGAPLRTTFDQLENPNALFGIVQGGMFEHLRDESAGGLTEHRLSTAMRSAGCRWASPSRTCARAAPRGAAPAGGPPRYLMGVGTPEDIVAAVEAASTCSTA
jgi:queuine tRNA-ribosyltransferase